MVNDGGTTRAKKWIDGKPVYQMSFNGTAFGNLDGLAAGATLRKDLGSVVPNIKEIVSENIQMAVVGISDRNRIGAPTTAASEITEHVKASLLGTQVFFKNQIGSAFGSGSNVTLYGWVEYTKTTD
jgi:hypothetical protein